jgi:hypothetical protein
MRTETGADLSRFSRDAPLVLWTDFPPSAGGGGAVILRSLLRDEDRARVIWMTAAARDAKSPPETIWLTSGEAGRGRRVGIFDRTLYARRLARETIAIANERGARAIWFIMDGAAVPVAAESTRIGSLPVHMTVHDDPAFGTSMRSRRFAALTPWIELCFSRAVKRARSIDVISEGMAARYRKRYGVHPFVVHRGIRGPIAESPRYDARGHGLRVGIMGQTYGYAQLPILGRAIARAARELGVKASVVILGQLFGEQLKRELVPEGVVVEAPGHVNEEEGVRLLQTCFVLYANYPFGLRNAVFRETSFPTKMGTYAMCARPILAHAPRGSTLDALRDAGDYVHAWTDLDPARGAAILTDAWRREETRASAHVAAEKVRSRYFDDDTNRGKLIDALNALAR